MAGQQSFYKDIKILVKSGRIYEKNVLLRLSDTLVGIRNMAVQLKHWRNGCATVGSDLPHRTDRFGYSFLQVTNPPMMRSVLLCLQSVVEATNSENCKVVKINNRSPPPTVQVL